MERVEHGPEERGTKGQTQFLLFLFLELVPMTRFLMEHADQCHLGLVLEESDVVVLTLVDALLILVTKQQLAHHPHEAFHLLLRLLIRAPAHAATIWRGPRPPLADCPPNPQISLGSVRVHLHGIFLPPALQHLHLCLALLHLHLARGGVARHRKGHAAELSL